MSGLHLPEQCGVMLLPDCTLFPHGALPLRIFEPRYREMLEDSIRGSAMFAVVRLTDPDAIEPAEMAAPVGTIGLIRSSRTQPDGTSLLLLHGVIRVRFQRWLPGKSYPFAEIEPLPAFFQPAAQAAAATATLRGVAEDYVSDQAAEIRTAVQHLLNRSDDPSVLCDVISQQFLQDPDFRQQLLETEPVAARIALLCRHLSGKP